MFKSLGRDNLRIMLALLVWALGEGLWYNIRQLYLTGLGAGPAEVGTALAIGNIGMALALLPAGYLIDRVGPRQMMFASWGLGIAGIIALILASTWQMAAVGLFIYGASAFALPAVSAYALLSAQVGDHPGGTQGVISMMFASYPVGLIISPAVGGLVAERWGIQASMLAALVMFVLSTAIVLGTRHVQNHPSAGTTRIASLLRNRGYMWRAAYFALAWLAMLIGYNLLPNFLKDTRHLDVATIGLLVSLMSAGMAVISLGAGRMRLRWGYPLVLAAMWLAMLGLRQLDGMPGIAASLFLFGAAYSGRSLAVAGLEKVVSPHERGMAFSLLEMSYALATAIGAQSAGILYKLNDAHDLPLVAGLVMLPLLIVVWFASRMGEEGAPDLAAMSEANP